MECETYKKVRKARLRYFGHVKRRDKEQPVKKALLIPVTGMGVGRQKIRRKGVLQRDMNKSGLHEDNAMSGNRWKKLTRAAEPFQQWE